MSHRLYSSNIGRIVDPSGKGDFTTIATALTASSSGQTIFIRPGTYTENLTLKAGVNLVAYDCSALTPSVTIIGKLTATFAGTCTIEGIRLQTNSDNILSITGSAATIVNLLSCYINATNATAIVSTTTSTSSKILLYYCTGNLGTTGIAYFTIDHGELSIYYSLLYNSGVSATQSVGANDSAFNFYYSYFTNAVSYTGSSTCAIYDTVIALGGIAVIPVTTSGTGTVAIRKSRIESGSQSAITVGAGTIVQLTNTTLDSSNAAVVAGAGTLQYVNPMFTGSSSEMTTKTQTASVSRPGITRSAAQPAFMAYVNTTITNVSGDSTDYTVIFDTEVYDQNGDFNLGTSTFTAPYTGKYYLQFAVLVSGGSTITGANAKIVTSNRTYNNTMPLSPGSTASCSVNMSVIADMDAGDTATFNINTTDGGGKIDDVNGLSSSTLRTYCSGYLVC